MDDNASMHGYLAQAVTSFNIRIDGNWFYVNYVNVYTVGSTICSIKYFMCPHCFNFRVAAFQNVAKCVRCVRNVRSMYISQ